MVKKHNPLRILLWAPRGAGAHYDGMGLNAWRMYSALPKGLVEVELVHGRVNHEISSCYHAQHLVAPYDGSFPSTINFLLKARYWLSRNAHRFDVMHCLNIFEVDVQPALLAERLRLPAVLVPANHHAGLVRSNKPWRRLLGLHRRRQKAIRNVSAVVAVSSHIKEELLLSGVNSDRIHDIPFGVDTQRFSPGSLEERLRLRLELKVQGQFIIIQVGEVSPRKRAHWVLPCLRRLMAEGVNVRFLVVGPIKDQKYWEQLLAEAATMGVLELVDWRGFVTDVERYYRVADVFILPSQNEGLPNAMLEAMATGLPVVCTAISGCVDVLRDGTCGRIVENEEQLASALCAYAFDTKLRDIHGEAARRRALLTYDLNNAAENYYSLFSKL